MDRSMSDVESELVDLTGVSLVALRSCDPASLETAVVRLLRHVERPHPNLGAGGSGPPPGCPQPEGHRD